MTRKNKPEVSVDPECDAALFRVTALAHYLAAELVGEQRSELGAVESQRATALVVSMLFFLLLIDRKDLHALFFADGATDPFAYVLAALHSDDDDESILIPASVRLERRIAKPVTQHT
jgi:hypothetical protein